ncbi:MAG: hypothetical protein ACK5P5_03230, partial [Pseudobdellovibrionaceae bacterium]
MEFSFQVPGKTFLLGEYAVLAGGKALIFCHQPYFNFKLSDENLKNQVQKNASASNLHPSKLDSLSKFFHPESPAGCLLASSQLVFPDLYLSCEQQYGQGGFGLSTAEFLVAQQIVNLRIGNQIESDGAFISHFQDHCRVEPFQLLKNYWQTFDRLQKKRPSGADLLAQSMGGFCFVDPKENVLRQMSWKFEDLNVFVLPTGNKLKTHEHLDQLKASDFSDLVSLSQDLEDVFLKNDARQMIRLVAEYGKILNQQGLLDNT